MDEQTQQLGDEDRRDWERRVTEHEMPPGAVAEHPVCDFCSHLEDTDNRDIVGYYRIGDQFVIRDFFPAGTVMQFPFAALLGLADIEGDDVPMDAMPLRDWASPDYFFVCPRHAEAVETDPRYRDRPAQPAPGEVSATGLVGAFFACRTSDRKPLPVTP